MLTMHVLLLIGVVTLTGVCLGLYAGSPHRSIWRVLLFGLPTWLLGVTSMLVLSARGTPGIEWILPLICILILGIRCKREDIFTRAAAGLTVAALLLCVNFFALTSNGYSAFDHSTRMAGALKRAVKGEADQLRKTHDSEEVLPPQKLASTQETTFRREWHTPLTQLYRIETRPVAIWYPGGPVSAGANTLEIKGE